MQPDDIERLVTLGNPAVSPDGRRVAFTVQRVDPGNNRYRSAVWLAEVDGGVAPYQLTAGDPADGQPAWSPDGTRLAVTTGRDEGAALRIVPVGIPGETVTLCERPEEIVAPVWSPDGTRIAFVSRERTARYDAADERAREPRRIDRLLTRLDGEGWIVDRPASVFVVAVDSSAPPYVVAGGPYEHEGVAWSPDSRTLAVVGNREPDRDLHLWTALYLADADGGGEPRRLTGPGRTHAFPSFSPDGTSVATLSADAPIIPSHAFPTVVDVRTGTESLVPGVPDRQCAPFPGARAPIWDDGPALWFSLEDRGDVHVYRAGVDGGGATRVLGGTRVVSGVDRAGGTTAYLSSTPSRCAELFVLDTDGTERRLTHLTDAFHAVVPGPDPVHLAVPSPAGDGDVDTWVLLPDDVEGQIPVLLSIHGGPMTQYANNWFDEFRLWAGAGYAVVWCNPHGSTGLTQAWCRETRAPEAAEHPGTGWAGTAADDVLAALDGALDRFGELDRNRVGMLGGSYGGYLVSWLAGHSDRFAAACSERSANNLESIDWSSDVAGYMRDELGVDRLTHPDVYRRMSPVFAAPAMDLPMLLLHSEDDLRCPVEQADALFVALRLLGKPVEYWRFPAESHGLSRTGSPRHRTQRARIILDFFGRHLGGARPAEVPVG